MPKECNHNWKLLGTSMKNKSFRCTLCDEIKYEPLTKKEMVSHINKNNKMLKHSMEMHAVYHKFVKKFKIFTANEGGKWRWEGYTMMRMIENYIKRNKEIKLAWCDDSTHCGSCLVLIPHKSRSEYWGTTVVYIPQYGDKPVQLFLYPGHLDGLMQEFGKFQKCHANMVAQATERGKS